MITAIRDEVASGQRAWQSLFRVVAVEVDDRKSRYLKKVLNKADVAISGDAFRVAWQAGTGASLLYLDPPAGRDPEFGRVEARWLHRFTRALMPGGALIAVVSHLALPAMTVTLARNYSTLRLARLPDADFDRTGQIVIWGSRVHPQVAPSQERLATLRAIAAAPGRLKVLGESQHAYVVAPSSAGTTQAIFSPKLRTIDIMALRASWRPLRRVGMATDLDAGSLIGARWPTAMAPRAAHLAMALIAGHFNGHALVPDDPAGGAPPIMIKGVYRKDAVAVTSKRKKVKDEVLEVVTCAERARLSMRILTLDDYEVYDPDLVVEPTGSRDPRVMNVSDIFTLYSRALAALMADQFPPIHRLGHPRIPTPAAFTRTLFRAQQQAYEAALKVFSKGRQPKLLSEVGTGKCVARGTLVLTADGRSIPVESLAVGDLLMGPDSRPRTVLSLASGVGPMFRITPTKGAAWECNAPHVLTLVDSWKGDVYDQPLNEFLAQPVRSRRRANAKLFRVGVEFPATPTFASPYIIGVWLGDGTVGQPEITACEEEIGVELRREASRLGLRLSEMPEPANNSTRWRFCSNPGRGGGNSNPFSAEVGRCFVGGEKRIPRDYLINDRSARLELLAGLVDTDGHLSGGGYEIITKFRGLSEDLLFLARSLGFAAYRSDKTGTIKSLGFTGQYHRVFISGDCSVIPCRLAIRKASPRLQKKNVLRTGFKVESIGDGEYFGFTLDGDGRFLLGDFTVTHNTTMSVAIASALHPAHVRETNVALRRSPGFEAAILPTIRRTLIVCPPHVVPVWEEEIQACWPSARVVPVENGMVDLRREAEFYILGREQAKLGSGVVGLKSCPRCGAPAEKLPEESARLRSRCEKKLRREPTNIWAKILAEALPAIGLDYRIRMPLGLSVIASELSRSTAEHGVEIHRARPQRPPRVGDAERARAKIGRLVADAITRAVAGLEALCPPSDNKSIERHLGPANDVLKAAVAAGHITDYAAGIGWGASAAADRADKEAVARMREALIAFGQPRRGSVAANNFVSMLSNPSARRNEPDEGLEALLGIVALASTWRFGDTCDEPLWSMTSSPRRYPLATSICRRLPGKFDLLIVDEAHEAANEDSAQSKAIHRLAGAIPHTMLLTGSIMGGYASSLFTNWWSIDREFRAEHPRGASLEFCRRYGFRKLEVPAMHVPAGDNGKRFGPIADSVVKEHGKQAGEAPGVLPVFVLRHLLGTACVVHKADLDVELPKLTERIASLDDFITEPTDYELVAEYLRIEAALRDQIAADAFTPYAGKLFGALGKLPSYLDLCCLGPFELRYPESVGGEIVVTGAAFPAEWRTPKERWLLSCLAGLPPGERAVLCLRNSRSGLGPRLAKMVRAVLGWKVAILESQKISPRDRQQWIRDQVRAGCRLLIVNPNAVRTGINSMTAFNHGIWYELDLSSNTFRQFGGRLHRTGQTLPVDIVVPYYGGTVQEDLKGLIARKVTASEQVDGLTVQGALEAAGAGEDEVAAAEAAMAMGEAIYERLRARQRRVA